MIVLKKKYSRVHSERIGLLKVALPRPE